MKIEIKSATISGSTNIRVWEPAVADNFAEFVVLDIGEKGKKGSDEFAFLLATPEGLKGLESESSILYNRPLVVVDRYDYDDLWAWLVNIVKGSEDISWAGCVDNLRKHFEYEYDGYKEY